MDSRKDQEKILQLLNEVDDETIEEQDEIQSSSEQEDNCEEEIHILTDESEQESALSSDKELNIARQNRNRRFIIDSDDDTLQLPARQQPRSRHNPSLVIHPRKNFIYGKNKHKWSTNPRSSRTRTAARNIICSIPGPVNEVRDISNPQDLFHLFVSEEMINDIVYYTNAEIDINRSKYKTDTKTISHTSTDEIKALLGLLIQSAAMKSNHLPTRTLFDNKKSGCIFNACMSAERFNFLIRCCRFDDKSTRQTRRATDKFAPFREFWEKFILNCKKWYNPSPNVTIDEQLVGFRGRCPFRMYLPNKPNKYGIKIVMLAVSDSKYVYNAMPYLGKGTNPANVPLATYFVKQLCEPLKGSNRTITMDNWFTSIPLASELLQPPYNFTTVGTLRSNKREIPQELKNSRTRKVGTSMFCYDNQKTLVSYKPKSNKVVYLLSTTHDQPDINPTTNKPEIIHYYNSSKGAVDTVDQLCSGMSTARKTCRWPLCLFYDVLNLSLINAYVIYVSNKVRQRQKSLTRRDFAFTLADSLVKPWLKERYNTVTLRRSIKINIEDILNIEKPTEDTTKSAANKRRICTFCPSKKRRMTKYVCNYCNKAICGEHTFNICQECKR